MRVFTSCRVSIASEAWSKNLRPKTYNRRDSQMVTHSSTSRPVQCLCMAERTGCPVLTDLWSYVLIQTGFGIMTIDNSARRSSERTSKANPWNLLAGRQASQSKNRASDDRICRHVHLRIDLAFRSSLFQVRDWKVLEQYKRMP